MTFVKHHCKVRNRDLGFASAGQFLRVPVQQWYLLVSSKRLLLHSYTFHLCIAYKICLIIDLMYVCVFQSNLVVYQSCCIVYNKRLLKRCVQTNPFLQHWLAFDNSNNFLWVSNGKNAYKIYLYKTRKLEKKSCTNVYIYIYIYIHISNIYIYIGTSI